MPFNAAKRLMDYSGKCARLHGYRHVVEATFIPAREQDTTMVADFYRLKALLGDWLEAHWDHNVILNASDVALGTAIAELAGQEIFYLPTDPTAEAMAAYLLHSVFPGLFAPEGVQCIRVRLYDDSESFVEVTL
ncbi:MAG: 6-carboxytetrahydropterin synthase [Hyphomicrobiales bacterium]|nr:6-carboxytetrahydropterin synthase [Hyphomicrobiales bacterium]